MGDAQGQEKPRFEPPPWEREAFEALAARRAEEDALKATLETDQADQAPVRTAAEGAVVPAAVTEPPKTVAPVAEEAIAPPRPAPPVDEKQVQAMLLQLQREEYTDGRSAIFAGWIAAATTLVLGGSMLVAGLTMARGSAGKPTGVMGSVVLSIFGLCFIGMSAWVWVRTTRLKGR